MKIFRTKSDIPNAEDLQETRETIQSLDNILEEIRHIIGYRRTLLKNAEKKLQEFQDTMYAMIMEDDYARRKKYRTPKHDDDKLPF